MVSVNPGIHGTKKRHVATHSTTVESASEDSSSLPLSAVIVPIVLITIGIVLGSIFVRKKRYRHHLYDFYDMTGYLLPNYPS